MTRTLLGVLKAEVVDRDYVRLIGRDNIYVYMVIRDNIYIIYIYIAFVWGLLSKLRKLRLQRNKCKHDELTSTPLSH